MTYWKILSEYHTNMKNIIYTTTLLLSLCFSYSSLLAQSLGEDAYLDYYLGRNIQEGRLFSGYGLNTLPLLKSIPNEWIYLYRRNNTLNDSRALFGQVDPVFRVPYARNNLLVSFKGSHLGELDLNIIGKVRYKKVSTTLRVNGHWNSTKHDNNQDNFLDIPLQKRLLAHNIWNINLDRFSSVNTIWYTNQQRQGGQWQFDYAKDYLTNQAYGYGQAIQHLVGESINYISVRKRDLLTLQFRVADHSHQDYYGLRQYTGTEWGIDTRAIYTYTLDNAVDQFRIGLNYHYNIIRENLDTLQLHRNESYGGGFVGYETSLGKKFHLSSRFNILYHNIAKWVLVPHLKLDFKLHEHFAANIFGGGGMRFANVLNENQRFLLSNRTIEIKEPLEAERAWNYGGSFVYSQWWKGVDLMSTLKFQFKHTLYENKIIADLDQDAYTLAFYNLDGKAEKFSFELDAHVQWTALRLDLGIDYRFDWYAATINQVYQQLPLQSMHTMMVDIGYRQKLNYYRKYIDFETQLYWYGPQRLPDASAKGSTFGLASTGVFRWDMKVTAPIKIFFKRYRGEKYNIELFVGMDNILQNIQQNPFIAATQPFSPDFDGGLAWQSTSGRRFYSGFKFYLK
jgi:hypothetical protein